MKIKKILLIEDEAALQKTIGNSLIERGYEIIGALDGEEGLQLAQETSPDLILLDLILPKKHGLDVLEALRNTEKGKNIPVIILTNIENISDIERAIELGAKTYLIKGNYSLQEILEKIEKSIDSNE